MTSLRVLVRGARSAALDLLPANVRKGVNTRPTASGGPLACHLRQDGGGFLPDRLWAPKLGKRPFIRLQSFDSCAPPCQSFNQVSRHLESGGERAELSDGE